MKKKRIVFFTKESQNLYKERQKKGEPIIGSFAISEITEAEQLIEKYRYEKIQPEFTSRTVEIIYWMRRYDFSRKKLRHLCVLYLRKLMLIETDNLSD